MSHAAARERESSNSLSNIRCFGEELVLSFSAPEGELEKNERRWSRTPGETIPSESGLEGDATALPATKDDADIATRHP